MKYVLLLVIYCVCAFNVVGQGSIRNRKILHLDSIKFKSDADLYWENSYKRMQLERTPIGNSKDTGALIKIVARYQANLLTGEDTFRLNLLRLEEIHRRSFREWGIEFWKKFPTDPRVFAWLEESLLQPPAYFLDLMDGAKAITSGNFVKIDTAAKAAWDRTLTNILETYPFTREQRKKLLSFEFRVYDDFRYWRNNRTQKFDLENWTGKLLQYVEEYKTDELFIDHLSGLIDNARYFFYQPGRFGLEDKDLEAFINRLDKSGYLPLKEFAQHKNALLALKKIPFELKAKTIEGNEFDLKNYRGKLVLLDFWSLGCATCIAKMPEVKKVLEKYRSSGFEVISICFIGGKDVFKNGQRVVHKNGKPVFVSAFDTQKPKILAIERKVGMDCPLVCIDYMEGGPGRQIADKYAFHEVPQLLLLDKDGLLVEFNGEMSRKGGLENVIKKHIEGNK